MMFLNHCFISIITLGDNTGMWPICGSASLLQLIPSSLSAAASIRSTCVGTQLDFLPPFPGVFDSDYCRNMLVIWGMTEPEDRWLVLCWQVHP